MEKSIWSMVKGVVKWFLPFYLFTFLPLLSCSEDSAEEGDFDNWQQKNETAISQWASNTSYRKILTYSKNSTISGSPANEDYIYVEVLESGVGSEPSGLSWSLYPYGQLSRRLCL